MDPTDRREAELTEATRLTPDVWRYVFTLDEALPFEAGQFVNLFVPGGPKHVERSYSVWSPPDDPTHLGFVIKLFPGGLASEYLRGLRVGDRVGLRGPFGHLAVKEEDRAIWFCATSTGIAPFHSMLRVAARRGDPRPYRLYFGLRSQEDLFALPELDELRGALPDFDYVVSLSRPQPGWTGEVGRITRLVDERHPQPTGAWLLCGNGEMVAEVKATLKARGLDRKSIRSETYW